ncbi:MULTISPECIES: hypothetical protein [unclassified Aureimonas]|uniref:hypothetical protein n=1 Tax=unclassified Aureimonas TaxID=2615206 RepID=UPI0007009CE1|nr:MULTISPECIES: hypothetical protein [unclassified Aureimonas]KQT57478.1 hypothetical protein ASG62_09165 [Aureimonas sp. Leaf427]KQT77158.1 hypothetical protein ASG54_13035 [Aureimonas sp. Leaf460]
MTSEVEIEALKPFNVHHTPQTVVCDIGDVFPVTATRAEQLVASGLARRVKSAPTPENKMAVEPSNKAAKSSVRKPLPDTPKE